MHGGLQGKRSKADPPNSQQVPRRAHSHPTARRPELPKQGPQTIDDFPEVMSVTRGELDVIETYLGALLDEMLGCVE